MCVYVTITRQEAVEGDADGPRITRAAREGDSGEGDGSNSRAVQTHALSARALGKRRMYETVQPGAPSSRQRGCDQGASGGSGGSSSGGGSSSSHAAEVPGVRGKRHRPEEVRPAARETRRRYERHEGDIDMDEEAEQRRLEGR